ncbi:hypothetical protein CL617_01870 [archaeon]|nr:hypothetical protein [archaeon]|tara:strand:- start:8736 stop:9263 length:528 start_codon:yes stop_codon:yes gene_type:complete
MKNILYCTADPNEVERWKTYLDLKSNKEFSTIHISSLSQLEIVKHTDIHGAIVKNAILQEKVSLDDALAEERVIRDIRDTFENLYSTLDENQKAVFHTSLYTLELKSRTRLYFEEEVARLSVINKLSDLNIPILVNYMTDVQEELISKNGNLTFMYQSREQDVYLKSHQWLESTL